MAPPRRSVAAKPRRRELLVFAEGAVTEEAYLVFWKRRFRRQVLVDLHEFHGTPMSLVEKAAEVKAADERTERRDRGRAHDEIWCIFDVDAHPHLREAIEFAKGHGLKLAISNPCIELWFLLHFVDQTAYIERRDAQREAKAAMGSGKSLSDTALELLETHFDTAKARARRLDEKHRGDGTSAPGNPSSGVWQLVDAMRLAMPTPPR